MGFTRVLHVRPHSYPTSRSFAIRVLAEPGHGNGAACRAVATQEGRLSFGELPPAVFLARVPGRVADDHHPAGLHAAQRLAQHCLSILAVVERGVEHGGVELVVRERKLAKAGLEAWEQRWQVRAVVTGKIGRAHV